MSAVARPVTKLYIGTSKQKLDSAIDHLKRLRDAVKAHQFLHRLRYSPRDISANNIIMIQRTQRLQTLGY